MKTILLSSIKIQKIFSEDEKIHRAIEVLLDSHVVSVNSEAKKYCYKTFSGCIGVVDKNFIDDRIVSGIY